MNKAVTLISAIAGAVLIAACGTPSSTGPGTGSTYKASARPAASPAASTIPSPASFSGQASLTDTQGYTLTLAFSGSLGTFYTSIANDPPGQEDMDANMNAANVTLTNTTPGRDLPDDFDEDLGGIQIGGFWPSDSAFCSAAGLAAPVNVNFPSALGGAMCYIAVASYNDPGGLAPGQSVDLTLQQGTSEGVRFSDQPEGQEAAFESAVISGPALWAVTSVDQTNQFSARCAPGANMNDLIAAQIFVLGITPHNASVPACQYSSS